MVAGKAVRGARYAAEITEYCPDSYREPITEYRLPNTCFQVYCQLQSAYCQVLIAG